MGSHGSYAAWPTDKKNGQELARAVVSWHNAVFAPDAAIRVADCGLGLMARRDLDNADVRALTMQFQACSEALFAKLSSHPRFQAGGVQGLLYGVGASGRL